ncbi:hypothetical protein [Paraliomyxa miuraensis]|uniref:hypothetical protein n=1 Tax=Paraliomyxa miuraensis TaxID=376150 RepID=UPI0022517776|nr:hypothetical protein [Paraliomyxa miuraensis]MCX4240981.1 hypothetical protein [Paraliomyxa miuraensis]
MDRPSTRRLPCALLLLLLACERRTNECNDLIGRMNPHTEALVRAVEGLARVEDEPARLDALVEAADRADHELAVIALEDARLAEFGLRYRKQLAGAREAAQAMRRAAQDDDPRGLHAAAKQADAFLETQATLLEELNRYCTGS